MSRNYRVHAVLPNVFPSEWASGWGEDSYGIWTAITFKGVEQRFRWCEPANFMMGSPQHEYDRKDSERPHSVQLTKGFWLADTTVTQEFYQAVTEVNPSHFQGDQLPVDSVSWDDVRDFLSKLNAIQEDLNFALPTEAQWEFGCRAGTKTPFFWGEQVDSDQVNFSGNYPYNKGQKSHYREKTIAVKGLPCNDWGLHQMHGNVLEWCADWYAVYPEGKTVNPTGPEKGGVRVLRGGSWLISGRDCRSAARVRFEPSVRSNVIGFRLAQGQ